MAKDEYRPVILPGIKKNPEGEKDVNELQQHFDRMMPKSGGRVTGRVEYMEVDKEPDPVSTGFVLYTFRNGNTLEHRVKGPNGTNTVLATSPV